MSEFVWPEGEPIIYLRPPKEEYHGLLPSFHPISDFPELKLFKDNWEKIRDEVIEYEMKMGNIKGHSSYASPADTSSENAWSVINLMSYMWKFHKTRENFPFISSIVDQVPNCTTAAISVLAPDSVIKPHYGDTNGIIRSHLGLIVPDKYPITGMKVGEDEKGWEEGEMLCFSAVCQHEVWSKSTKKRYLLIIDIVPKTIENRIMEICSKTLGSQTYIFLYKRVAFFRLFPSFAGSLFSNIFSIFWRVYLPIQRKFKFL